MSDNYEQQLQFTFKPKDATPEQIAEWHEKEGKWWADKLNYSCYCISNTVFRNGNDVTIILSDTIGSWINT